MTSLTTKLVRRVCRVPFYCSILLIVVINIHGIRTRTHHSSSDRMNITTDGDDYITRHRLTVTTLLDPPYMMLKPDSAFLAGNDRFEGYLADILQQLAKTIQFQYEIRLSRDAKHGVLYLDTVWDGMIGEIQRQEADIAAGALIITQERRRFVEFTEPFLSLRSSALIHKPTSRPVRSTSSPFAVRPTTTPVTVKHLIFTADHLLASDLSYGVVRNSIVEKSMSNSMDPLTRALWSRVATFWPTGFVDSIQEGVERARREHFAFIVDSPMAAYISGRKPCDLYSTEPFLDQMFYAFAVSRDNLWLKQAFDREIRQLKSSGQMQAMYLHWWRDECNTHNAFIPPLAPPTSDVTMMSPVKVGRQAGLNARSRSHGCDVAASTMWLTITVAVSIIIILQ